MMMANDSSQPSSRLDDESLNAVRLGLRAYLRDAENPTELRSSLLLIAAEARTRNILPEHLLVTLKEVWSTLPEVRSIPDAHEQVRLLQRVVTMCIQEYYNG